MEAEENGEFLVLTYRRNANATGLAYQVQSSESLADDWSPVDDVLVSSEDGFETRKASVTTAGFPHRWLRLKVDAVPED